MLAAIACVKGYSLSAHIVCQRWLLEVQQGALLVPYLLYTVC